jgi:hypothetical protein
MTPPDRPDELLAELRRLAQRFPLPHPIWHRYVPEMHAVIRDLFVALEAVEDEPRVQAELRRRVDEDAADPPENAGGPTLAAARARLRNLPVPEGEHPYRDEIAVTLAAARALLGALAVAGGEAAFARQVGRRSSGAGRSTLSM